MAQNKQYLDLHGLQLLWNKIKSADESLIEKINGLDFSKVNDIKYVDGKIALWAGDVQIGEGFDASAFIADGMMDDIDIVSASPAAPIQGQTEGKFIKFTWNVTDEHGEKKVDYISVKELQVDLSGVESRLDSVESKVSSVESLLSDLNNDLSSLQSDVKSLQSDVEVLKNVSFEDITKDGTDFVGESENAPKTSTVVSALNDLRSELMTEIESLTSIDLNDYYKKEEINDLMAQKQDLMEAIPEEEILGILEDVSA